MAPLGGKLFLATFSSIGIPPLWIAWVNTCLNSAKFSFLINFQPTPCISFSRGIRQGDPLSKYLFIIASHNLITILNKALGLELVPVVSPNLISNFNHLMYADDLLLVTRATHNSGKNCILCLDIYFPSWINKRLARNITNILNFSKDIYLFTYLGVLVAPKKPRISCFQALTSRE